MDLSYKYHSKEATFDINDVDVPVNLWLDESGESGIEVLEQVEYGPSESPFQNLVSHFEELSGTTSEGYDVTARKVTVLFGDNAKAGELVERFLADIPSVQTITIEKNSDYVFQQSDTVTIKFDAMCLKPSIPYNVNRRHLLIEENDWAVTTSPIGDSKDRIDFVKSHQRPIRTAEIRVTQELPGTLEHHVNSAVRRLDRLLPLIGFAFGVCPSYTRATAEVVNGVSIDNLDKDLHFSKLYSTRAAIGSAFRTGELVNWNTYWPYLHFSYRGFTSEIREDYRLRQALGYYWDALNSTRPVEGRFLSVCSAIELLAKRYMDYHGGSGKTQDRIEQLINSLDVETEDLATMAGTTQLANSQKYFYSYSRQYVVHGDNNPSKEDMIDDFLAALALLQRIIRIFLFQNQDVSEDLLEDLLPPKSIAYE